LPAPESLAAAYAERHRRDCRLAWWIGAHEDASLHAGLVGLGIRLGWVNKDEKEWAEAPAQAYRVSIGLQI
jgi:hypothetical protein